MDAQDTPEQLPGDEPQDAREGQERDEKAKPGRRRTMSPDVAERTRAVRLANWRSLA